MLHSPWELDLDTSTQMQWCIFLILVLRRQGDLWATLYWEGCLGLELWSVLESTWIAVVLPLSLLAFPSFIFPSYQLDRQ